MTGLTLKIIAVVTMIIDHTAVALRISGHLPNGELYETLRAIGRIAFPLYGFMLAVGARYTRNKAKYLLRMFVTLLLSEVPFDLAIFGTTLSQGWMHQNVYFTLFFGLATIFVMQWAFEQEGVKKGFAIALWLLSVAAAAILCERILHTDYGDAGILMIAVFGLLALPLKDVRLFVADDRLVRLVISAAAVFVLVMFTNTLEYYALFALFPIGLHNGNKGYSSRAVQYGFYLIYPLHLLILGLVFVLPLLRLRAAILWP